jgi:hypothetical protein
MNHNGQENIDLREPVASWQKVLISLVAVLLMSILLSCCLKVCGSNQEELIARLAGAIIVAAPALCFTIWALYFWWGKKYLTFGNNALVIHLELLWFKRTRYIMLGRRSQIIMRQVTYSEPDDHTCSKKLELHVTDSYGQRHRLLHYEPSQKERVVAICHEICRQYPELTQVQEDWPRA